MICLLDIKGTCPEGNEINMYHCLSPQLTDQTWLPAGVRVPLHQVPYTVKGCFCFLPPSQVTVVGSYLLGTCVRPDINVDMAVTMPRVRYSIWGMERPAPLPPTNSWVPLSFPPATGQGIEI